MHQSGPVTKGVLYLQLFAFAALPILLLVFVVKEGSPVNPGGSTLMPIFVSCASGVCAFFFWMTKLGNEQRPEEFQTFMLLTLAFGELITLMGVFIASPTGMSPLPFVIASYVVFALVAIKVVNFWMPRR